MAGRGFDEFNLRLVRALNAAYSELDGAALLWFLRNRLLLRAGLPVWADTLLMHCESLIAAHEQVVAGFCRHIGLSPSVALLPRSHPVTPARDDSPFTEPSASYTRT